MYHATLKILASKIILSYITSIMRVAFSRPDKIVLGRLGYDCRTR